MAAPQPLGDARYLLSPGDLYALRQIPEIVAHRHRRAQDRRPLQGRRLRGADHARLSPGGGRGVGRPCRQSLDRAAELQLEQVYSRGLGPYFLNGTDHQAVVRGRAPRHRGVLMGRVTRVRSRRHHAGARRSRRPGAAQTGRWRGVRCRRLAQPRRARRGRPRLRGGAPRTARVELRFGNGALTRPAFAAATWSGARTTRTLDSAARPYLSPAAPVRKQPVRVRVTAREGAPLETEWQVGDARA